MSLTYWLREVAGWALLLIGLYQFWNTYNLLLARRVFEAGPSAFIGFVIFRGGVHILKVAVAAQAARSIPDVAPNIARRTPRAAVRQVGPTPPKSVLPGPKSRPAAVGSPR